MEYFAKKILTVLGEHSKLKDMEICAYGLRMMLQFVITTISVILLGWSSKYLLETIIAYGIFCLSQSTGGGYHAKTHMRCYITMILGTLMFILSFMLNVSFEFLILLGLCCLLVLLCFPCVLHEHKAYLKPTLRRHIKRSRIATITLSFFFGACIIAFKDHSVVHGIAFSLLACALSRTIAVLRNNQSNS